MNTIALLTRSLPHRTLFQTNGETLEYSLQKHLLCLVRKQARWCYSAATIFDCICPAPKITSRHWDMILHSRKSPGSNEAIQQQIFKGSIFLIMFMCVEAVCVHECRDPSTGARGKQRCQIPQLELQVVVTCPIWVLGLWVFRSS